MKLPLRARYFPDQNTSPVAEFVRGELQITAPVDQVASPDPTNVRAVLIDIKGENVSINFSPAWSSLPLSAEDRAGINLLIRNALKTSFLPSSNALPDNVNFLQFKTLLGSQNAVTVLLNMNSPRGNPASMNDVFLRPGHDFALAAGRDFVLAAFPVVRDHRVQHIGSYDVSNVVQVLDLQDGQLVFTMTGHVHRTSWPRVDFNFTASQALTLDPVATTVGGPLNTVQLVPVGDVSLQITGGVFGWILNQFKGLFRDRARQQRDAAIDAAQPNVRFLFNIDNRLGTFLQSLLKPPHQDPGAPPPQELKPVLAYTFVEIRSSGIVLHGSLAVANWPPAHLEFQQIPANSGGPGGGVGPGGLVGEGPDYSGLKTWIPGGTIERYEWGYQGQPPFIDVNKFVYLHPPPGAAIDGASSGTAAPAFRPLCLTVRGSRLSSSGPVVSQPVSATVCGYTRFDVLQGLESTLGGAFLRVALTQPGPGGLVEVAGHASARSNGAGGPIPNRIVHFADDRTSGSLEFLVQALREGGRKDASAAVLAVLTPGQLTKARHTEGVIYAEDQDGDWGRAFGVKTARRPVTLIAGPNGKILWQHEGDLDSSTLAAALRKVLAPGAPVRPRMLGLSLRIGRPAPNFLFELAPGRGLTLRKLAGRPVTLVFWKISSKPSIEAVRDVQKPVPKAAKPGPVVLAINDGEAPELAKRVATENRLSAIVVVDPQRSISLAYGVNLWPTIVSLDASGLVTTIRYGRFAGGHVESPSQNKAAASR